MNVQELDLGYANLDIRFAKGNDREFNLNFTHKNTGLPVDLTDYVFTAGLISPIINFSVNNSNPTTGIITISILASVTTDLTIKQSYKWYLSYIKDSKTRTLLQGVFTVV